MQIWKSSWAKGTHSRVIQTDITATGYLMAEARCFAVRINSDGKNWSDRISDEELKHTRVDVS